MHKQIVVTSITEGKTRNGGIMWTIATLDGGAFTLFEDTSPLIKGAFLMAGGARGAVIAIDYVQNGEYQNLTVAKFITKIELPDRINPADSKDLSVTLSYAVQLASNGMIASDKIQEWATKFYWHVTTMPVRQCTMTVEGGEADKT